MRLRPCHAAQGPAAGSGCPFPGFCSKPKSTCSDTVADPDYVMRLGLRGITYADRASAATTFKWSSAKRLWHHADCGNSWVAVLQQAWVCPLFVRDFIRRRRRCLRHPASIINFFRDSTIPPPRRRSRRHSASGIQLSGRRSSARQRRVRESRLFTSIAAAGGEKKGKISARICRRRTRISREICSPLRRIHWQRFQRILCRKIIKKNGARAPAPSTAATTRVLKVRAPSRPCFDLITCSDCLSKARGLAGPVFTLFFIPRHIFCCHAATRMCWCKWANGWAAPCSCPVCFSAGRARGGGPYKSPTRVVPVHFLFSPLPVSHTRIVQASAPRGAVRASAISRTRIIPRRRACIGIN